MSDFSVNEFTVCLRGVDRWRHLLVDVLCQLEASLGPNDLLTEAKRSSRAYDVEKIREYDVWRDQWQLSSTFKLLVAENLWLPGTLGKESSAMSGMAASSSKA